MVNGDVMCDKTLYFVERAREVHGDRFSYEKAVYVNHKTKVKITCKKHGVFEQRADNHLQGKGCQKCTTDSKKAGKTDFVKNAKAIHGNKYKYGKVYYKNNRLKVIIVCPLHGDFKQSPGNHLKGKGCPVCRESKGERIVGQILKGKGLSFKEQFKFDDCRSNKGSMLKFDFYIESLNLLIEFDGEQHFQQVKVFGGNKKFLIQKENDNIKNEYCLANDISLLRIKYNEDANIAIEKMLKKIKRNGVSHVFYGKNIERKSYKMAA